MKRHERVLDMNPLLLTRKLLREFLVIAIGYIWQNILHHQSNNKHPFSSHYSKYQSYKKRRLKGVTLKFTTF
jgi:hypothetical protein